MVALLCLMWAGLVATAPAQGRTEPVTTLQEFWNLSPVEREQPIPYRFDLQVTFYDPVWKLLWAQDHSRAAYISFIEHDLLRPGARVRVEGTFPPGTTEPNMVSPRFSPLPPESAVPVPLTSIQRRAVELRNKLVELDGLVERQELIDSTHLRLIMSADGLSFTTYVLLDPAEPVPQLAGAVIRITGVSAPRVSERDELISFELMTGSTRQLKRLWWLAEDARFERPSTPIEQLPSLPKDTLVRVTGRVHAQEPGRYLRIRDQSGQVDIRSGQTHRFELNELVEAVGYPDISGMEWRLADATFRSLSAPPEKPADQALSRIRLAAQVMELSPEDAAVGHPVTLSGVVTWSHPDAPFYFIRDASRGISVFRGSDPARPRAPGRHVEVQGVTGMGAFAPIVIGERSRRIGDLTLPEARQISLEHALTGVEEAQWVEMRGYLRQITRDGRWTVLEITTSGGVFSAYLPNTVDLSHMIGAVIRMQGVCSATANDQRKLTSIRVWVPSEEFVQVEEAAPADPFSVPSRSMSSLGQFGSLQSLYRRVKVSGTVLLQQPGRSVYLGEEGESLLVLTREAQSLQPGDRVEAVGFPGRQSGRVVLRESILRKISADTEPQPKILTDAGRLRVDSDGRLVRMQGVLIDSGISRAAYRLTLQSGDAMFEAVLAQADGSTEVLPQQGSTVSLVGVYELRYDDDGAPIGFQLLLRSLADVKVLRQPSWFTRGRVLAIAVALTLGILLVTSWVVILRRQVQAQTAQIRDQLQREAQLQSELQRATRLESLGLLAGGIAHDFNNLLTIVMGNLSLASLDEKTDAETMFCLKEAMKAVTRAKDLTQQLLTFSKGGSPIRAAVSLSDVVREVAGFALHGSKVRSEILTPPELWSADVDKGQIGQVVQNIVINAREVMAEGGMIAIELKNETIVDGHPGLAAGRYVRLSISDTGPGIPPENLTRIFEPYFTTKKTGSGLGLATVYSIIKKHHGHITVQSQLGHGSRFEIWLPAAAIAEPASQPAPAPAAASAAMRGRVLFMDDEADIRRIGQVMLARLGFEATGVADGAEALDEFTRAIATGRPYDAVILDLTIPGGVGGRQTIQEMLRVNPAVRAIVSSGYSNDEVLANYRQHGFRGRVTKPYEIAELERVLRAVVQGEIV